jgi:hypothetical protein
MRLHFAVGWLSQDDMSVPITADVYFYVWYTIVFYLHFLPSSQFDGCQETMYVLSPPLSRR